MPEAHIALADCLSSMIIICRGASYETSLCLLYKIMSPDIGHHPLQRADGSASYSDDLYTILAGVNGPIEVQRRDELYEEAAIEVNLRAASGVGGPRERWLESTVTSVIRSVLLVHLHPRTLIQVTLQVTKQPVDLRLKSGARDISVLPALVNASFLALVDGGLPLETSMSSVLGVVSAAGEITLRPTEKELALCRGIHALAYSGRGELLLTESSGGIELEAWEEIVEAAQHACQASLASLGEDDEMAGEDAAYLRNELVERAKLGGEWRDTS